MSSMRMSRRTLLKAAGAAGAAAFGGTLVGCGGGSSSSSSDAVTYWDWYVSQAPWVDNEIKLFRKAHPDITIKKTTQVTDKYADLLSLAFRSNNAPDIFMVPKTPPVGDQVRQGWLRALDSQATEQWQAKFPADSFPEGINTFDGKVYSAPFSAPAPSLQLYVHNGVFKEAGLTNPDGSVAVPKTWDDVSRAAATIKANGGGKVFAFGFGNAQNTTLAWWLDLFVRGAGSPGGSSTQDYRTGTWTYGTDRNYADFLALLVEWKKQGYFYPSSMSISDEQARAFFERGRFGMTIGGVWNQPQWTEHKFTDYSLMTLPAPDGTPKAFFYGPPGGTFVAISAKSPRAEQAWAWFDWLYSPEAGKRWVEAGQGLSVYPQNNDASRVTFKPFAQYVAMADKALIGPQPAIRNSDVAKVVVNPVKPDVNDVLAGVYTGQLKDIPKALSELAGRQQQALDAAIKAAQQQGAKVSRDDYVFPDWDPTKPYSTKPGA